MCPPPITVSQLKPCVSEIKIPTLVTGFIFHSKKTMTLEFRKNKVISAKKGRGNEVYYITKNT